MRFWGVIVIKPEVSFDKVMMLISKFDVHILL